MIDLEREVRELLDRRAEEAASRAGERISAEMHRRVRQRQARTVIMSGLAAALVAVGALAGARALLPAVGREPGAEAPTPPFRIGPNPPMSVIASGELRSLEWNVSVGRDGETWCVEVEATTKRGGQSVGSCERNPLRDGHLVANALNGPGFPAVVVSGFVSKDVDRVVFDFDAGGQIEGTVYPSLKEMNASFDVFVIVIPEERPARGLVMALDADGEVLDRDGVYESYEARDAFGNVVGYIPLEDVDRELTWAPPGSAATIHDIRETAERPLTSVWPTVSSWWQDRPPAEAPDDALLDWWAAYPVTD